MALTNLINADKVSKMNKKPVGLKTIDIDDIEGERRYTALKELVDEGKIEPEVYCIIYEAPESELNDRLRLILGNGTRIMSELDKIKIIT